MNNVKDKYIFYNDKKEILVLYNGRKTVFIPSVFEGETTTSFDKYMKHIIDLLTLKNEVIQLASIEVDIPILKCENNKLKKVIKQETKNYFSCYCNFSQQFFEEVMKLYYEEGIEFSFINIDQLKEVIQKRGRVKIDKFLLEPLEELDKRLSFKKY